MTIEAVAGFAYVLAMAATLVWIAVEQRRDTPSRVFRAIALTFDATAGAVTWAANGFWAFVLRRTS